MLTTLDISITCLCLASTSVLKWCWWHVNSAGYFCGMAVGIVLQTPLVALPIFFVVKEFYTAALTAALATAASLILWKTWYQKLAGWPHEEIARENIAILQLENNEGYLAP